MKFVFGRVENIVRNGGNAGIISFFTMFSKTYSLGPWLCIVMGYEKQRIYLHIVMPALPLWQAIL